MTVEHTINPNSDNHSELAYRESLSWLYRQTRGSEPRDPARMARLIEALSLEMPARSVHVVGTNGKGTVTSMIAAGVAAAGVDSGSFLSPHVEDFRERISVNGRPIDPQQVVEFVDLVRSVGLPSAPAFFEITLAMALHHFKRSGAAFASFEAGVGARHDATAVLEGVVAVAITPIAPDHLETLGPGLREIAQDKSAALRRGVPGAAAEQSPVVLEVLEAEAQERGSQLHIDTQGDLLFTLPAGLASTEDPVRARNQRLAAATLRLLGNVPEPAISLGLAIPPLPGRGERFLVGEIEVLLDGAHDPAAGRALVERAGREYVLLFGSLRRKQGEGTLRSLEVRARRVFVTSAGGELPTVTGSSDRTVIAEPREALLAALAASPPGGLLLIGGSLYLAGELRPLLRDLQAKVNASGTIGEGFLEDR